MVRHVKLFTPGPGDVADEVVAEMGQPVIRHYGPEWMEIYNETMDLLRQVYQTKNDIFIVPAAASAVHDMVIGSLAASGQEVIIGENGFFGQRLVDIANGYGLKVVPFTAPWGEPLDPAVLAGLLREHPAVGFVALVHHETSTTVLNPLRELAGVVRDAGKVIVVDAVSSLGGVELPVDDWGVDVCVTAANKCFEAFPGLGIVSVGRRAWDLAESLPPLGHGWYLDLKVWRHYAAMWGNWHPSPVTLPVNNVLGMRAGLRHIVSVGLDAHMAKYAQASKAVRQGLSAAGFEPFVSEQYSAPIVTGFKKHPDFEIAEFSKWLLDERDIAIGGGLGDLSGKMFRVGHLGKAATREYLVDFLFSVEEFMRYKGISITPGACLVGL